MVASEARCSLLIQEGFTVKRFLAGLIVGIVLATATGAWAQTVVVRLIVDGQEILFPEAPPQILNGRVMVPARPLAEALGGTVRWDAAQKAVVVTAPEPPPPVTQVVTQTVTETVTQKVELGTPYYVWANLESPTIDWNLLLVDGEKAAGVILQNGTDLTLTTTADLSNYLRGELTADALLNNAQGYVPEYHLSTMRRSFYVLDLATADLPALAAAIDNYAGVIIPVDDWWAVSTMADFTAWANGRLSGADLVDRSLVLQPASLYAGDTTGAPTPPAPLPVVDCTSLRQTVEFQRNQDLAQIRREYASRGTLGSSMYEQEVIRINTYWDGMLAANGC